MRITSKIMQSNSLTNMNRNKVLHDKLNTQMTTMKKLTKASDDPVIAIRALRLRTSVSEITQYAKKNVPDARSWLDVTEGYLLETQDVLTDIIGACNTGVSGYQNTQSRQAILKSMKSLREQIYSASDADYAGRGLFTGFRTETKGTFQLNTSQKYSITEQLSRKDIDTLRYIDIDDLGNANGTTATDQNVGERNIPRMRLGYGNLDANVSMSIVKDKGTASVTAGAAGSTTMTLPNGDVVTLKPDANGKQEISIVPPPVPTPAGPENVDGKSNYTYTNAAGEKITIGLDVKSGVTSLDSNYTVEETITVETVKLDAVPSPYDSVSLAANDGKAIFIPETGELLLGKDLNEKLGKLSDKDEIRVSYDKTEWKKGDLNPVNYFSCETQKDGKTIEYNPNYLTQGKSRQEIEYDVGFNQTIRVNTTADEVFSHDIGRDVDEIIATLEQTAYMDSMVEKLKNANPVDEGRLAAALKAQTLLTDKLGKMFESGLTSFDEHLNTVSVAVADSGTRDQRLDMIESRLTTQLTTFDILASENENIDLTEVAIQLGSVELAYEAALMAVGKVAQTSLLNYI